MLEMMLREPARYQCFWCDRTTRDADLVVIDRSSGKLKCKECVEYDRTR